MYHKNSTKNIKEKWGMTFMWMNSLSCFPEVNSVLSGPSCRWDRWGGRRCTGQGEKAGQLPVRRVLSAPRLDKGKTPSSCRVKGHEVPDTQVQGERQVSCFMDSCCILFFRPQHAFIQTVGERVHICSPGSSSVSFLESQLWGQNVSL